MFTTLYDVATPLIPSNQYGYFILSLLFILPRLIVYIGFHYSARLPPRQHVTRFLRFARLF